MAAEVMKMKWNARYSGPDTGSELLHRGRSVAVSPCLSQCTFYTHHLGQEEGRGPLGRGSLLLWGMDGPKQTTPQHSDHPLSPTRTCLGGKVNGKCDPLLNDLGGDKRWLIDTTYHADDMHVTMCLCCWMRRVTWYARKSLQVPKTAWCPGNVCYMKHFTLRCMDGNIKSFVLDVCGGCKALCWCCSNAEAVSLFSSTLSNRKKDYNLISLSGARNHFFFCWESCDWH